MSGEGERLQKVLARVGFGSRRVCEDLIAAGRVTIDGAVAVLGARVDVETAVVAVDGAPVGVKPDLIYYLLNKPSGVITTADDPKGRETVVDLVPNDPRVFSVGRLDGQTEGLLIMTNDGQLTHHLTHPSFGVEKEYLALVKGTPSRASLRALRDGIELDDGWTSRARVTAVEDSLIRITIHEGRNRQVRRMFDAVGHQVIRLVRTRIGPIVDPRLKPGTWRELSRDEVRQLEVASSVKRDPKAAKSGDLDKPER